MRAPLVFLLGISGLLAFSTPVDSVGNVGVENVGNQTCGADIEEAHQKLVRCVRQGDKLVKKYLRHLKSEKRTRKFLLCRKFSAVQQCFDHVTSICPSLVGLDLDWKRTYEHLSCVCSDGSSSDNPDCHETHACFERHYWGPPSDYCEEIKATYSALPHREICLSIPERTHCHSSHVTLICGRSAGEFTYHVTRLFLKRHLHRYSCSPVAQKPDLGFLPSGNCSETFLEDLETCESKHIPKLMKFSKYNALVAASNVTQVKLACRQYKAYKGCVRDVKTTCKAGYRFLLAYDPHLRTYLDRMEFICREANTEYLDNLQCYQRLVRESILFERCRPLLEEWKPLLDNVTSFQYYCEPNSNTSIRAKRGLDRLRMCYHDVVTGNCGIVGGVIFDRMQQKAYQDPLYLQFALKPTCPKSQTHSSPPVNKRRFAKRPVDGAIGYTSPTAVEVNVTIVEGPVVQTGDKSDSIPREPGRISSSNGVYVTSGDTPILTLLLMIYSWIT